MSSAVVSAKALELLAQGHGHRVLQLGPPHLEHVGELLRLLSQRVLELTQGVGQIPLFEHRRHPHSGGIGIVGRLTEVDVIVGMAVGVVAPLVSHELQSPIGDDLVGIHVGRGTGAALDHVHHEVALPVAVDDLLSSPVDGIRDSLVQQSQLPVGPGRRLFDHRQAADQVRKMGDTDPGDGEVFHGAQGLNAVAGVLGDLALAQQVVLGPGDTGAVDLLPADTPGAGVLQAPDHDPRHGGEEFHRRSAIVGQTLPHPGHRQDEDRHVRCGTAARGVEPGFEETGFADAVTSAQNHQRPGRIAAFHHHLDIALEHENEVIPGIAGAEQGVTGVEGFVFGLGGDDPEDALLHR
jgi:hypothetical protein